jgi:hypothetical protein
VVHDTLEKFESTSYSKTEEEVATAFTQQCTIDSSIRYLLITLAFAHYVMVWYDLTGLVNRSIENRDRCNNEISQRRRIVRKQLDQTSIFISLTRDTIDIEHHRGAQDWSLSSSASSSPSSPSSLTTPSTTTTTPTTTTTSHMSGFKPLAAPTSMSAKTLLTPASVASSLTSELSSSSSSSSMGMGMGMDTRCSQLLTAHIQQCSRTSSIDDDIHQVTSSITTKESLYTTAVANAQALQKVIHFHRFLFNSSIRPSIVDYDNHMVACY